MARREKRNKHESSVERRVTKNVANPWARWLHPRRHDEARGGSPTRTMVAMAPTLPPGAIAQATKCERYEVCGFATLDRIYPFRRSCSSQVHHATSAMQGWRW